MGLKRSSEASSLREVQHRAFPRSGSAGLLAQLRQGTPEQRRWAARDLSEHPEAAQPMGDQLLTETDASVREALFGSLEAIGTEDAAAALLPLLRTENAGLRNGAIEALSAMPEQVAPRIETLLCDPDSDVRIFTVNLLADLRHQQVLNWLTQVLSNDANVNVVAAAIEVLAEAGQPEHIAALRAVRDRFADDLFIAFAADMAIERIEAA